MAPAPAPRRWKLRLRHWQGRDLQRCPSKRSEPRSKVINSTVVTASSSMYKHGTNASGVTAPTAPAQRCSYYSYRAMPARSVRRFEARGCSLPATPVAVIDRRRLLLAVGVISNPADRYRRDWCAHPPRGGASYYHSHLLRFRHASRQALPRHRTSSIAQGVPMHWEALALGAAELLSSLASSPLQAARRVPALRPSEHRAAVRRGLHHAQRQRRAGGGGAARRHHRHGAPRRERGGLHREVLLT